MKEKFTFIDVINPYELDIMKIECFVSNAFNRTGRKFWIQFNGSKGYLDNVEIYAEGTLQSKKTNRIELRKGNKEYLITHSNITGVHII